MKKNIVGNVLVTCRVHWVRYWLAWLLSAIFIIGFISVLCTGVVDEAFALLLGAAVFALPPLYRLAANCIILTDKMIYSKNGLIKTRELTAPIDKIQNIEIKSGLLGKCFGYSTVRIDTITELYSLKGVKNADLLRNKFYKIH